MRIVQAMLEKGIDRELVLIITGLSFDDLTAHSDSFSFSHYAFFFLLMLFRFLNRSDLAAIVISLLIRRLLQKDKT